jgi:hypothetical protein
MRLTGVAWHWPALSCPTQVRTSVPLAGVLMGTHLWTRQERVENASLFSPNLDARRLHFPPTLPSTLLFCILSLVSLSRRHRHCKLCCAIKAFRPLRLRQCLHQHLVDQLAAHRRGRLVALLAILNHAAAPRLLDPRTPPMERTRRKLEVQLLVRREPRRWLLAHSSTNPRLPTGPMRE